MDELKLKTFVSGPLSSNCYLILSQDRKKGCLIDSPWDSREVVDFIKNQKVELAFILLTHGHFDHIHGLNDFECPFYIHPADKPLLGDPQLNGSFLFGEGVITSRKVNFYNQEQPLNFSGQKIEVIHTPGHTPGSTCIKIVDWLFSGDTLFFDSVGRTDIPLASPEALISSLQEKVMVLPDATIVYPGHGSSTTIGRENKENPFL
ncbi:MAG: MBL fold metallo-hydrolase [Candidatus Omnitrophica bacterium]|nr:MBL fold metallo-hydrolase [Candidatus Omnitrophota bacterium]